MRKVPYRRYSLHYQLVGPVSASSSATRLQQNSTRQSELEESSVTGGHQIDARLLESITNYSRKKNQFINQFFLVFYRFEFITNFLQIPY